MKVNYHLLKIGCYIDIVVYFSMTMTTESKKGSRNYNAEYLFSLIYDCFNKIPDHRANHCKNGIPFDNFIMSALAMMHKKCRSLREFDSYRHDQICINNYKNMYHIKGGRIPSDTHMRDILDLVNPIETRKPFKKLFALIQRGGALKKYRFRCGKLKGYYLMPIDGTGLFHSKKCGCDYCCKKNEGKPNEANYHNLIAGCIVHPNQKTVIPFAPEAIVKQDGKTKNDCEKNALRRYLEHLKREHPHLKLIILLDGLYADNPTLALIRQYGWHYIIVAKDGNHEPLIEAVNALYEEGKVHHHEIIDNKKGIKHKFRFANNVTLNLQDQAEQVNVLDYIEIDKEGKQHFWSWVTDIELTEETVEAVMIGGRCRWHIENQTFNTLKKHGYHLEHNYGHGKQHLATNFAYLTFLAFMVDQILEMSNPQFQKALQTRAKGTRIYLWELITRYFRSWLIESWDELFEAIIHGVVPERIKINSS